jgi:hypothetical protein
MSPVPEDTTCEALKKTDSELVKKSLAKQTLL